MINRADIWGGVELNNCIREGLFVDGKSFKFSPLCANIILESDQEGLLYNQEVSNEMRIGDILNLYVKKIREDGKIDFSLEKGGYRNYINASKSSILKLLKESNGFLPFTDKSSPEDIQKKFSLSKSRFKEAIGSLYRDSVITIGNDGIRLN